MGTLLTAEVIYLSSKCVSLLSGLTTQFDCLQPIWKKPKPQKTPIPQKTRVMYQLLKRFHLEMFHTLKDFQKV